MTDEPDDDVEQLQRGAADVIAGPEDAPNTLAMDRWEAVVDDMEVTADEYEAAGWETLQLHPGDVASESGNDDRDSGLDVVVPGSEYERLSDHVEAGFEVDEIDVFRADGEALTYVLFAMLDDDMELAVFAPTYYRPVDEDARTMFEHARETGSLALYIRQLDGESVRITVEDPDLVAPETGGDERSDSGSDDDDG